MKWRGAKRTRLEREAEQRRRNAEDGFIGNKAGRDREVRVLTAVRHLALRIDWIIGARRATEAEDAHGIDLVVMTDRGELHLQVKSTGKARSAFKRSAPFMGRERIAVVLGTLDRQRLQVEVLAALIGLRAALPEVA